jgi:urease accessory protein
MVVNARRPVRLMLWGLALAVLLVFPVSAEAHSPIKGLGDFANGLLHPLTIPAHVLVIVGLGLMAGRRAVRDLKAPLWVFAPLSGLALALTATGWVPAVPAVFLISIALGTGVLLALERFPCRIGVGILFAAAALGLGFDSAAEGSDSSARVKILLGNWLSLNLLIFDLAIYVTLGGEAKWLKTALRIAGAWMMAISILMIAFSVRP